MFTPLKDQRFPLIELPAVIAIIGSLIGVFLSAIKTVREALHMRQ